MDVKQDVIDGDRCEVYCLLPSSLVSADISEEPYRWGFAGLSETSVLVSQITRHPMPEDSNLHLAGAEEILFEDVHRKLSC